MLILFRAFRRGLPAKPSGLQAFQESAFEGGAQPGRRRNWPRWRRRGRQPRGSCSFRRLWACDEKCIKHIKLTGDALNCTLLPWKRKPAARQLSPWLGLHKSHHAELQPSGLQKHRLPAVAARALRQARQPSPGLCLHNSHQAELQPSGLQKHRLPAVAALPARGLAGTTPIPNC